jgi:hypothetical protein
MRLLAFLAQKWFDCASFMTPMSLFGFFTAIGRFGQNRSPTHDYVIPPLRTPEAAQLSPHGPFPFCATFAADWQE